MMHDIFKLTALLASALTVTGCAASGHGYSCYNDHYVPGPVYHHLRPAPNHPYYFYSQPYVIETARTRFQPQIKFDHHTRPAAPRPMQFARNIRHENGVAVHRHQSSAKRPAQTHTIRHIEIAPDPVVTSPEYKTQETYVFEDVERVSEQTVPEKKESRPELPSGLLSDRVPEVEHEAASKSSGVDIAYIKIGGGSDLADWQACEKTSGGYVEWTESGFTVDPAFDNCMRVKGYKPESETEEDLTGGN